MFVLLNGAFGIGKTTVARRLAADLERAAIYDPERIGFLLQHLPAFLLGRRRQPDDFQDLRQWRRLIVIGARAARRRAGTVLIPMAFSRLDYFSGFAGALARHDSVRAFCLTAPLAVIEQRLAGRAGEAGVDRWTSRRAAECCIAHDDARFGERIDATPPAALVAATIRRMLVS